MPKYDERKTFKISANLRAIIQEAADEDRTVPTSFTVTRPGALKLISDAAFLLNDYRESRAGQHLGPDTKASYRIARKELGDFAMRLLRWVVSGN